MSIIYHIRQEMMEDDEDESGRLMTTYENADAAGKALIDDVLMSICGWGYATLLGWAKEDDDWDGPCENDGFCTGCGCALEWNEGEQCSSCAGVAT